MTSRERVLAAFDFQPPDRIPRFDSFWDLPEDWIRRLGPAEQLSEIAIRVPDEGTLPSRARVLRRDGDWTCRVDSWGRTVRERSGSYFSETIDVPIPEGVDPDSVDFEPPELDSRYETRETAPETQCVFGKTGGPYLRTSFIRGQEQFLMDIAGDPPLARALADKMADHLIGVAREQIRRWSLQGTGVWIYDDMASNRGPMFSPESFEKVLLPAYRRMIKEYKQAGAKYVVLHSDGNIMPILDMLVDAGIDGLHPLERRAGMEAALLRSRYPTLVLIGGMCNTDTLIRGPVSRVETECRDLIDLGRRGGFIVGTHSVSPEIPLEHFEVYHRTCVEYGDFLRRPT